MLPSPGREYGQFQNKMTFTAVRMVDKMELGGETLEDGVAIQNLPAEVQTSCEKTTALAVPLGDDFVTFH